VRAMSVYLQTLPAHADTSNADTVRGALRVTASVLARGHSIYEEHCKSCHLDNGAGQPPGYPPLAHNQSIEMSSAVNPIRMVLNGEYQPQTAGNPRPYGMPPFAQILSDADIAAVVTYIRVSWGNHGQPITTFEVNTLRSAALLD
jgi:mono/diheme cytochrome c family protein